MKKDIDKKLSELADIIDRMSVDKPKESDIMFGTVKTVSAKTLSILIDGATTPSTIVRACSAEVNDRVVIVKKGTIWVAVAVRGSCPFPVGFIVETDGVNPQTSWPGTTWEQYGNGRFTVGFDASQSEFKPAGDIGGVKEVALTESQMPSHTGHIWESGPGSDQGAIGRYLPVTSLTVWSTVGRGWLDQSGGEAWPANRGKGSSQAHTNLPPYVVVYRWRRTA